MKKIIFSCFILLTLSVLNSCSESEETEKDWRCGTYKGDKDLWTGPKGGCYYINDNGNKTYVERSDCKC